MSDVSFIIPIRIELSFSDGVAAKGCADRLVRAIKPILVGKVSDATIFAIVSTGDVDRIKSWSATAIARRRLNTCIQRSETRIKRAVGMSL